MQTRRREVGGVGNRKLLLEDDGLVNVLICTCSLARYTGATPHVFFEICTLKAFVKEILLCDKIKQWHLDTLPVDLKTLFHTPHGEKPALHGAYRDYAEALRQRNTLKGGYRLFANQMLPSLQEAAQSELLEMREPSPRQLAQIYRPLIKERYATRHVHRLVAKMIRQVVGVGLATIDLGPSATMPGDSDHFKERVQTALAKMRETQAVFAPLLTTVGITVIYVPPTKAQRIDLDNLVS